MWAIFIKVLYDSSLLVKVVIWALGVYLIGYVLYEMFGWAGIAIPLLAIVSFVIYELTPSKEQRLYNKLKKERVSINNDILLSHPQATVIDCYRFDDNLPRVYELITENYKSERDDMFDIFFSLLPDLSGIKIRIVSKATRKLKVVWNSVKIAGGSTTYYDGMLNTSENIETILPNGERTMKLRRREEQSYYYPKTRPIFYTPNKRFTVIISIGSSGPKSSHTYKLSVKDLTQKVLEAKESDSATNNTKQKN